jgi:deazaflavin-dependent oxidoreductase (nitroreductase family)
MPVEITPKGTRGVNIPKLPRPLSKAALALMAGFHAAQRSQAYTLQGNPPAPLDHGGSQIRPPTHRSPGLGPDGDNAWLIVASFAGAAAHPARYHNMAKNPDKVWIEIGKRKLKVHPGSLKGPEREQAWRRIVSLAPYYGEYEQKTDREIPVGPPDPHASIAFLATLSRGTNHAAPGPKGCRGLPAGGCPLNEY